MQIAPAAQKESRFTESGLRHGTTIVHGVAPIEINADNLRDARLLHSDAVDNVGLSHRAFTVGDYDELSGCAHVVDQLGETAYVGLVKRSIDFVENAEGCGLELEDSDQK